MFVKETISLFEEDLTDAGKFKVISVIVSEKIGLSLDRIDVTRPLSELGADSLDQAEVMMIIEDYYGVEMQEPEYGVASIEFFKKVLDEALLEA